MEARLSLPPPHGMPLAKRRWVAGAALFLALILPVTTLAQTATPPTAAPSADASSPTPPSSATAPAQAPEALFAEGANALASGDYAAAIDLFEALADRGFVHPDASYDRGLAYALRARAKADRPGDLGRAAAAFEETLHLRPGDIEAERALDTVRAEITRRRSRRAKDAVDVRPTLDRVVVGLASEQTWGLAALLASVFLAVGIRLRRQPTGHAHVAGSVLTPAALVALLILTPLALFARHLRLDTRPGVIVVQEAYLTDASGRTLGRDPVPEGASVEVGRREGSLIEVRWGASEGWIPASSVRIISP
ncbi:hypothetical protein [Chondromyces crocatus]|uniref:SH3b domain-containing protein n=1 Tax=Chondromyces crocatus TaxID=52 RepID=A0A0K1ESE1_CHOCO|nr:hypothetical protein [Chondromyces crocatus]AKT43538.1 uncharacterized protein CMC5_077700 [Chondromyces crocatus]